MSELKTIASNRRATFDYNFLITLEMGMVLTGHQVKSIRDHSMNIGEAYGYIHAREIWLKNLKFKGKEGQIKLLAHRSEINKIMGTYEKKSYVLIPLEVYERNGKFKVMMGLGTKTTKHDKREKIKKRDLAREQRYFE